MGKKMKRNSRNHWVLFAALSLTTVGIPIAQAQTDLAQVEAAAAGVPMRWDLISVTNFSPVTIVAGGKDSAKANDGSQITLTGTGTFLSSGENIQGVTGGGTWTTLAADGATVTGSGTYIVTELVSWEEAPGTATGSVDKIGDGTLADNRGGLAVFRIRYSDGSRGVLTVSCDIPGPTGSPATVFEGITASKGFVNFWNRVAPVGGIDGNRTLFHVLGGGAAASCSPSAISLCLGGRFKVQVSGTNITGFAIPNTADTGDFWFYSPNNIDVVVKVLDGRAFNNRFWVFIGSLSDRAYTVTVTDTVTGAVKTYTNPPGTVADTTAF
jgi:hypothetical protein